MTVGERVLAILKDRGISQKDFSALTGIPQSTISSWKSRKQNPGIDKFQIICDTLKIDPYYLLSGTEAENKRTVDFIRINKEDKEYELILEFRKLDDDRKNRLMGYVHALRGEVQ